MTTDTALQALYYPYADVQLSRPLLEACLYLDRVYVLEPGFFRAPRGGVNGARLPHSDSMRPLVAAGVVEPAGPALLGLPDSPWSPVPDDETVDMIQAAISQDLADDQLIAMTSRHGHVTWAIPTGQQLFWNGLGILLGRPDSGTVLRTDRLAFYHQFMNDHGYGHHQLTESAEVRDRSGGADLQVEVPFMEAESLMLTVALHASAELALYPITDNRFHQAFMHRKLTRMLADADLKEALRPLVPAVREADLGLHAIRLYVPRLEDLDAERVLRIRERCGDSLEAFRVHMRSLSYKYQTEPWSPEFHDDTKRIIATEVQPALDKLRGDLSDKARGLGVRVIGTGAKATPLPLIATLVTGLPPAIALAAGLGVGAVHELATYLLERRTVRRNGLYFLLDAAG